MNRPVRSLIGRTLFFLLLIVATGLTAFVLILRLWILPNLDQWPYDIAASVSLSVKQKVVLGKLSANWQHWHPQLYIESVRVLNDHNRTTLFFSGIKTELSWTSLLYGELRFARLSADDLVLSMRRDKLGTIYLAGIVINGPKHKNFLGDWLLNQHEISINDATLSWQDDMRGAPELIISRINLDLINHGRTHKFRLFASPPPAIAHLVDVSGEFTGKYLEEAATWRGRITVHVPYTNLALWQPWLTLPFGITRGYGNVDLQLRIADKQFIAATATTALRELSLQFTPDLPVLNLRALGGMFEWKRLRTAQTFTLRRTSLLAQDQTAINGLNSTLRLEPASTKAQAVGDLAINTIDLQTLSRLASYFPLGTDRQKLLAQRRPAGLLTHLHLHWQGEPDHLQYYHIVSEFSRLGLAPTPEQPGFSGLSGHIDADIGTGTLALNSNHAMLDLTNILFIPHIALDTITAQLQWNKTANGYAFHLADAYFSNTDAAGNASGDYQWQPGQRGTLDLTGSLTRGDARAAYRYLPLVIKPPAYNWLKSALLGGKVDHAAFHIKGDLAKFPFLNDQNGQLDADVQFTDGILQPGPEYPQFDHINGDLKFFGTSMTIRAESARLYNARLYDIGVAIPDLFAKGREVLYINGAGQGDISDLIRFANNSPVAQVTGHLTKGAGGSGQAEVLLHLQVPLYDISHPLINGSIHFLNDSISPAKPVPTLDAVSGKLDFTERSIRIPTITLRVIGGPATVTSEKLATGAVRLNVAGMLTAPGVAPFLPDSLAAKVSGATLCMAPLI